MPKQRPVISYQRSEFSKYIRTLWTKKPVRWETEDTVYYSVVFSWHIPTIKTEKKRVVIGGPGVYANREAVPEGVEIGEPLEKPVLNLHNPFATRTSTGCIRLCKFCIVPDIEGGIKEIPDFIPAPIIIDNNLLACSKKHFDRVIDRFKGIDQCDFNQGLDARLLTTYHARRFAELKHPFIRLAFDDITYEMDFVMAAQMLVQAGIPKSHIPVYVLIGFDDTPANALYRLECVTDMGLIPFPMRYQPINTMKKNNYIGDSWTHDELDRYMAYWSNLRIVGKIPFEEFMIRKDYRKMSKV
jgi:hypothetical protein